VGQTPREVTDSLNLVLVGNILSKYGFPRNQYTSKKRIRPKKTLVPLYGIVIRWRDEEDIYRQDKLIAEQLLPPFFVKSI